MPQNNYMSPNSQPKDSSARQALAPIDRKSVKSGLINEGAVGENERPETSVMESVNFNFDAIGSATLRKGYTKLGTNIGTTILGMHYHVDTIGAPTNTQMIAVSGTTAFYLSSGTFTSIRTGLTSGQKARFVTYLNFCFMVNGTEATAIWDGNTSNTFVTTGNALSAPIGSYIENFRSRVWITGNPTYPDRLYYSTVPTSVTTPVIVWNTDVATGQWIDISPSDGDTNTALQRFRSWLIVFKTNRLYRVFDIGQVDPDPYYAVGTSSQESVIETKAGVFFHHASGIYQFNVYGIVQEVSRPVWDIIRAIPASYYPSVAGWLEADGDHVVWCVGTVTVRGVVYSNLHIRYTISTMTWTHYCYATAFVTSIRRQPFYTDGTIQFAVAGDSLGNVYELNTGKTDDGTPISYSIVHKWDNLDGLLSTRKTVMQSMFSHYGGTGSTVAYQTDDDAPDTLNDWSKKVGKGVLKTINTGFNTSDIKGRKVRFRIFGQSVGEPFIYNGYELIAVQNEFIQFPN